MTVEEIFGPAERGDLDALVRLDAASPRPWRAEHFAQELDRACPGVFVVRANGEAVAFAVTRTAGPEMDILNLAVDPGHRGRGVGLFLVGSLLEHAAARAVEVVFLEVREGNVAARSLYRKAGFRETQRRPDFYREPVEDAVLMRLEIGQTQG